MREARKGDTIASPVGNETNRVSTCFNVETVAPITKLFICIEVTRE
jgi:hypothetical protein